MSELRQHAEGGPWERVKAGYKNRSADLETDADRLCKGREWSFRFDGAENPFEFLE